MSEPGRHAARDPKRAALGAIALPMAAFWLLLLAPSPGGAAPYGAAYTVGPIGPLEAGATVSVPVTIQNTGDLGWPMGGANPVSLSYHWDGPEPVWDGARTPIPRDLGPSESATIAATLRAPSTPGVYRLQWDLVHEHVTWFSQQGVPTWDQGVTVEEGGALRRLRILCAAIDCLGLFYAPHLSGVFGLVIPGAYLAVLGQNLGERPGQLFLHLAGTTHVLTELDWHPGWVAGRVPADITGLMDGPAGLQIATSEGRVSNVLDVPFRARREVRLLPRSDVSNVHCSDWATRNSCNWNVVGKAFAAWHWNSFLPPYGGIDVFDVRLSNGWSIHGYGVEPTDPDEVDWYGLRYLNPARSAGSFSIATSVGFGRDTVVYWVPVSIIGPQGVPHR